MLKISKLKKIKSNFPVIVGEQIISKKVCNSLIKEITNSKSFDDMIMGGRSRINKGSKNFNKYISSSKISKKLFATFNTQSFYEITFGRFVTTEHSAVQDLHWSEYKERLDLEPINYTVTDRDGNILITYGDEFYDTGSVSYTHLTLPTIYSV